MATTLTPSRAKTLWLNAQGLLERKPFGQGPAATPRAIAHLGYVQIDTINVIERCHHHILYNRIPDYERRHLHRAQSVDKSVFEYWTHALSYIPTKDFRYFMPEMRRHLKTPNQWFQSVSKSDMQKVLKLIKTSGAISIRDIKDDVLQEKDHDWASRKPSKRALQLGFYSGQLAISERIGMLKKYDLLDKHFDWQKRPTPATEKEVAEYYLDRALRTQVVVSLDSICHLQPKQKPAVKKIIDHRVTKGELVAVTLKGAEKIPMWIKPQHIEERAPQLNDLVHILSPFDPLVIQRKRLKHFFNYEHLFEAYVPPAKRVLGYFALPVLRADRVVAALDLKTDRNEQKLLIQKWNWIDRNKSADNKQAIEEELHRFERFQLAT